MLLRTCLNALMTEIGGEVGGKNQRDHLGAHLAPFLGVEARKDGRLRSCEYLECAREVMHLEHRLVRIEDGEVGGRGDVERVRLACVGEVMHERSEQSGDHVER